MKRREFLTLISGTAAAWPIAARAQQANRNATVGILAAGQPTSPLIVGFLSELNHLGYVEGRNLTIEFRTIAGADPARIADLAAQLVQVSVDIIVTDGTPTSLAAKQATTSIPIVMAAIGGDPTGAGLVQSYARPGGNITGFTLVAPELGGKRLQILKEAVPGLASVGLLWNAANPLNPQVKAMTDAAAAMGIEIEPGPVQGRDEYASTVAKRTWSKIYEYARWLGRVAGTVGPGHSDARRTVCWPVKTAVPN
jgi:putative tryptophan/tyrosine transport system substrate-binding protein